jgi:hypothetical protein
MDTCGNELDISGRILCGTKRGAPPKAEGFQGDPGSLSSSTVTIIT